MVGLNGVALDRGRLILKDNRTIGPMKASGCHLALWDNYHIILKIALKTKIMLREFSLREFV